MNESLSKLNINGAEPQYNLTADELEFASILRTLFTLVSGEKSLMSLIEASSDRIAFLLLEANFVGSGIRLNELLSKIDAFTVRTMCEDIERDMNRKVASIKVDVDKFTKAVTDTWEVQNPRSAAHVAFKKGADALSRAVTLVLEGTELRQTLENLEKLGSTEPVVIAAVSLLERLVLPLADEDTKK